MALSYPWSAAQQGAEEYLRWVLVARPRLDGDIAQLIRAALARWDAQGRRA